MEPVPLTSADQLGRAGIHLTECGSPAFGKFHVVIINNSDGHRKLN